MLMYSTQRVQGKIKTFKQLGNFRIKLCANTVSRLGNEMEIIKSSAKRFVEQYAFTPTEHRCWQSP